MEAMSSATKLGKAVKAACEELEHLGNLVCGCVGWLLVRGTLRGMCVDSVNQTLKFDTPGSLALREYQGCATLE